VKLKACACNQTEKKVWSPSNLLEISFQVASMQFINIVVHSVEDMNFRVHLQYEFTKLGLDEYLDVSMAVTFGVDKELICCPPSKEHFHSG
jgi:hypothetical protein